MTVIHVAAIYPNQYLFLKKADDSLYQWFKPNLVLDEEEKTLVVGSTVSRALAEGYKAWQESYFRLLHCGFRYSLPERDEVGSNALFWQMALSYNSPNGRYFDEEVGHLCYVDFASQEALGIWRKIRP